MFGQIIRHERLQRTKKTKRSSHRRGNMTMAVRLINVSYGFKCQISTSFALAEKIYTKFRKLSLVKSPPLSYNFLVGLRGLSLVQLREMVLLSILSTAKPYQMKINK